MAAVLLMVDPRDLGLVAQVRSPHQESPTIYLYEAVPGGIGINFNRLKQPLRPVQAKNTERSRMLA